MARNSPLSLVRSIMKAETFQSLQSTSTADDSRNNQLISDVQSQLAGSYDWEFLKKRWSVGVGGSNRFVNFPTQDDSGLPYGINFDRPHQLFIKWNNVWQPTIYGIDEYPEYNYLDSDRNQVLDPVQRWQFYDENQFEIWPVTSSGQTLRFVGQRILRPLLITSNSLLAVGGSSIVSVGGKPILTVSGTNPNWNDNALLDLDDFLVAYFAAASWLGEENPRYKSVLAKAQQRLATIHATNNTRTEPILIGRGQVFDRKAIRQVPMVLVAGR